MTKEKQIEDIARDLCDYNGICYHNGKPCDLKCVEWVNAQHLYEKGYRKSQDVAREIIDILKSAGIDRYRYPVIAEIEKKYIGEDTNVRTNTEGEG